MNDLYTETTETIKSIAEGFSQTTTAIAKINEIARTNGISKRKSKRLLLESETNLKIAEEVKKWCENNPGFYYEMKVGNLKINNMKQILELTKQEFKEGEVIPKSENYDWMLKFLDVAGETSDEEKQRLLSKVLAGEMRKPNTISYRSLRILKDMSRKDLVLFRKAISCCFNYNDIMTFIPKSGISIKYLSVAEIMYLNECGLLDNGDKNFQFTGQIKLITSSKKYMVMLNPKIENTKCDLTCIYLTESAMELFRLMNVEEVEENVIKNYLLDSKCSSFDISLHPWVHKENGSDYYSREDILTRSSN